MMKKIWPVFLAGALTGALALGSLLALTDATVAEAETSEIALEQTRYMRDMADSLREIERALEERCQ
jgi:hypothetical protein